MKIDAELLNEWRCIPRLIIALYGYVFWDVLNWFMDLDVPTTSQAMFVSTVVGAAPAFFGLYVSSGGHNHKNGGSDGSS